MPRTPTLAEVLRASISGTLENVHTAIPGRVTSYNAATQQADIEPLIQAAYLDEEGERQVAKLPVVTGCPVAFPGGGGFTLIYPLQPGDTGLLIFSEASIDKWMSTGGNVDPDVDHRFALSDGIFVPGIRPFSSPRSTSGATGLAVGLDAGHQIQIDLTGIRLGATATEPLIKGTSFGTNVMAGFLAALAPLTGASSIPGVTDFVLAGAIQTFAVAMTTALVLYPTTLSTITKTQ